MKLNAKIPDGPIAEKWTQHQFDLKLINPANKRKYEIIVVGTGLAGASAAATLAELGYNIKVFAPEGRIVLPLKAASTPLKTINTMAIAFTAYFTTP